MIAKDVAIVGVGSSNFHKLYAERDASRDPYGLAADAFREALDDCGIDKHEIDGLLCTNLKYGRMGDVLGLTNPRFVHDLEGTGRMSGVALQEACAIVQSGLADVVACVYATVGRSVGLKYGGEDGGPTSAYDTMYGMTSTGAYVSLMYQRYRKLYGVPDDALAPLAINNRRNGARNPNAVFQREIDRDEYLAARFIAEPLRKLDYCIINDGAVAFIVTSIDRARSMRKTPVRVAGTAGMGELRNHYTSPDFYFSTCEAVGERLYRETGIGPGQIDCMQVYDNFLPTILFTLEGFGHAPRGSSWEWVADGAVDIDGSRPLNTSGGHTSESYMQGFALHVEAVRQLRGEGGARQVEGCRTVQYMCASPIVTSHIFTID
ncbi:thiolase family protein [Spongiactinospora sp. TRM90649]|uniref:thiolase family protein n=1 Tax=Spongiactinospora sp. TRM90649 TaxID=3031114 RepID=UPI0023F75FD8|nr:thiolase family protein [Spongiactinospora sp. TRM90649]MDF5754327.1 thiolase family protein [Spongiactinospora sp. TRM90649]